MKKVTFLIGFVFCTLFFSNAQTNIFSHPFSVSSSQTVLFSQGNVNLDKGTNKMYFATHQVRCFRSDNVQTIKSTSGTYDLFMRIPLANQKKAFEALGDEGWRTLTASEWNYLLNERITRSGARYLKVYIASTFGMFIFPDDFECPSNIKINVDNINKENPDVIQHFGAEWYSLEKNGVVFLPAAGRVSQSYAPQYSNEDRGYYWIDDRTVFIFSDKGQDSYEADSYLFSYRLVKNHNIAPLTSMVSDYHSWNNAKSTDMEPANVNQSTGPEGTFIFSDEAGRKIRIKLYNDRKSYNQHQFTFAIDGQNISCTGDWGPVGYGDDYYVHIHLNTAAQAVINPSGETKSLAHMIFKGDYVYLSYAGPTGPSFKLYRVQ